jgi:hypothetical protein
MNVISNMPIPQFALETPRPAQASDPQETSRPVEASQPSEASARKTGRKEHARDASEHEHDRRDMDKEAPQHQDRAATVGGFVDVFA